jgi:hypothetical protein
MFSRPVLFCHSETANKHQVFGGLPMNGRGSFGGLGSTGILPVFRGHGQDARATQGNLPEPRSSERSEESTGIFAPLKRFAPPAGFFAALRMTNGFKDTR